MSESKWDEIPYDMDDYYRDMDVVDKSYILGKVKYLLNKVDKLKKRLAVTGTVRVNPKPQGGKHVNRHKTD